MMGYFNAFVEVLSQKIGENFYLAPLFAVLAGIFSSFMPCCLSQIPLVISYVNTKGQNTKNAFFLSLTFALGNAFTFTILAVFASLLGRLMQGAGGFWYIILGVLMLLMALQTWEIFNFIPASYLQAKNRSKGFLGAFLTGALGGLFSSPCATPVLVVLLAIVAKEGRLLYGIVLLLCYSLGHSVLVVLSGTFVGFAKRVTSNSKYPAINNIVKFVMGLVMAVLGFYMFYLGI